MSTTTSNLNLFKYTENDYEEVFNFQLALNENWDKIDQQLDIISLSGTTPSLTANRVHKITCSSTTTFTLPTGNANSFSQMIVLLYMSSVCTIYLKQDGINIDYFGGTAPDMSTVGYYTIIYEYDSIKGRWTVGVLKKAS